ncbi:MAG: hypothetical protein KDK51_07105, partial [Deltaproteobacteria bacterium]|nr:hypothetical protein [Deltaproteobacteria bacterium]
DWVFEAKSRVETVELDPEEFNSENHYLLFHMLEMEDADREKLQEFIEMHKAGKTVIEDIQ